VVDFIPQGMVFRLQGSQIRRQFFNQIQQLPHLLSRVFVLDDAHVNAF
jgi:hypothetical protein